MTSAFEQFCDAQRQIAALPPAPSALVAHHGVPYGRAFRQWDTRGRLLVWVNRGQIEDLPRADVPATGLAALAATPVLYE